ncbi:MAG: DUF4012 domain-containing protein [Patescibacteria group bacterium]
MPKLFLIPEIESQNIQVFLNIEHHPLAIEITNQLSNLKHVQLIKKSSDADVTIYLVGFDSPSLSETLSHTSDLYEHLKQVKSDHHKFILVVKNPASHLSRTAITLTNQFAHNYDLNHEVFEYDHTVSTSQLAETIIRKFIYGHSTPHQEPRSSSIKTPTAKAIPLVSKPQYMILNTLYLILALATPWLLSILLLVFMYPLTSCLHRYSVCTSVTDVSLSAFRYTSRLSPGSSELATQIGLPLSQYKDLIITLKKLDRLTTKSAKRSSAFLASLFTTRPAPQTAEITASLEETDHLLNQVQADLRSIYLATPNHIRSFESLAVGAGESRHTLSLLIPNITSTLRNFTSGKKTYLVALQDNWELRGSGGLIEAFLKVDISHGQIDQFQPFSTRDTDKLLTGTVTTPADFQDLTDQTQWYLRDASWDPNISSTLTKIAWFAQKELNQPFDGVILVDLNTLKELVRIIGSVQVGESKVPVTAQNFSAIYQSQLNSSDDYNKYLTTLLSAIFAQFSNMDDLKYQKVIQLFYTQVVTGQVFITGLAEGEKGLPECRSFLICSVDYAYPVSSNITGSKTNLYLTRSHTASVSLSDSQNTSLHTFSYRYSPEANSWVGQNHQEYLRLYLPDDVLSDYQVSIDGVAIPKDSIHIGVSQGSKYLGVSFTVNKLQDVKVQFSYHTPMPKASQFHYQLDIPSQPGVVGDQVKVELNYPPTWAALVDKVASVADAGRLEYNYAHPEKFQLNIDFTKP